MELVEIKDIRPNQIYKHKNENIYIVSYQTHYRYILADCYKNNIFYSGTDENEFYSREFEEDMNLIGFIGITHKLENNKLVEIKREEFEVGDIVEIDYSTKYVLCETDSVYSDEIDGYKLYNFFSGLQYITIRESDLVYKKHNIKKIGIYDVNFEFKNKKLIKG